MIFLLYKITSPFSTGSFQIRWVKYLGCLLDWNLRYTAASLLLNHGIPGLVVSKILRHLKASTTPDIYGYLIPENQQAGARIMHEIITPISIELGKNSISSPQNRETKRWPTIPAERS